MWLAGFLRPHSLCYTGKAVELDFYFFNLPWVEEAFGGFTLIKVIINHFTNDHLHVNMLSLKV